MEEVNTNTPVVTEKQEERGQEEQIKQEEGEQIKQREEEVEGQKEQKKSNWIPRYRLNEVIVERDGLKEEIKRLQGLEEKAKVYDSLIDLIEKNPGYAQELNELYQKHFGEKKQTSETEEFEDENYKQLLSKFETLESEIRDQKMQNLQRQWDQEMQEINQDAKRWGITISESDIYKLMDSEKLYSPKQAYNLFLGREIDKIRKIWESNLQKDLTNKRGNFPSIPLGSRSVGKLPSSIEEAFDFLKT